MGADCTPPLENVEKQHDEHQRIVFVLVHAGEERHAASVPVGVVYCRKRWDVSGGVLRLLFSALPAATVESFLSKHACERSVQSPCVLGAVHGVAEGGGVDDVPPGEDWICNR